MARATPFPMTLAFLACVACGELDAGPVLDTLEDAETVDAAPEGGADLDAGQTDLDATPPDLDATPPDRDAARTDPDAADPKPIADAGIVPDMSWGPCVADGERGDCLSVDDCAPPMTSVPGFCPGPAEVQCCVAEADEPPVQGCDPDEHPQPNQGLVESAGEPGCPAGMIVSGTVCVDRYEASLVLPDGSSWSPYHHPGPREVIAVSIADAVPQGYIDGVTAERACDAAGKRLCTNEEWLRACQGAAGDTYPYGDRRRDGVCNDARAQHPAVQLFPNDPNPFDRIQHPCINQLADGLATTGARAACVTADGAFDMMGNLHEWTADPDGTFRGGFYVDTVRNGPGCLYRTTAHNRQHWDYSTGFRCCAAR